MYSKDVKGLRLAAADIISKSYTNDPKIAQQLHSFIGEVKSSASVTGSMTDWVIDIAKVFNVQEKPEYDVFLIVLTAETIPIRLAYDEIYAELIWDGE